jgi:hypothetical protein
MGVVGLLCKKPSIGCGITDAGVEGNDIGPCFFRGGGAIGELKLEAGSAEKSLAFGVGGTGIGTGGTAGAGGETVVSMRSGGVLDLRGLNFGAVCRAKADCELPARGGVVTSAGKEGVPFKVGAGGGAVVVEEGCEALLKKFGMNEGEDALSVGFVVGGAENDEGNLPLFSGCGPD